jgi:alpha-glucoside transport system permease protein
VLVKALVALVTVVAGIGAALLLYFVLNLIAERLPGNWEERLKPYLYILPAFLAITIYLIYPMILTLINSFKDNFSRHWIGFANYRSLFGSSTFVKGTLFNTLLWILIVPAACVILGLTVATLADRLGPRGEKTAKTIIFLPMAVALVGSAVIWHFIYDSEPTGSTQIGLLNGIRSIFHQGPVAWLNTSTFHFNSILLMVILIWGQVGFSMVLLSAAVKGVPVDTIEAARMDGASERQIFGRVVLPQIRGTIITVFVTVTIGVLKVFDVVYVTTGGDFKTDVLGNQFFTQISTFFNYGAASAIVVIMMAALIPIMWYQVRHFRAEEAA